MSERNLLEEARHWRDLVLLVELAGWLHDLGKLSNRFLEQHLVEKDRRSGESDDDDPAYNLPGEAAQSVDEQAEEARDAKWDHEKVFEYDGSVLSSTLKDLLERPLTGPTGWLTGQDEQFGSSKVGLKDLVQSHHRAKKKLTSLESLLKNADGEDSGEDEYSAAASQSGAVQKATIFGREEALADGDLDTLNGIRQAVYSKLEELLTQEGAPASNRSAIWDLLQEAMSAGLGKSQRAANDIRLDQHTWGVASRLKAFLMRKLLQSHNEDKKFNLLSVQWDSWAVVTPFARLSDVVGRQEMLRRLRDRLRDLIEDKYALGNRIYEDDDGIHFMIAAAPYEKIMPPLSEAIRKEVNDATDGEVQAVIRLSEEPTQRVTDLVKQMTEARSEVPPVGTPLWTEKWKPYLEGEGNRQAPHACVTCWQRPTENRDEPCDWCQRCRGEGIQKRMKSGGTVWMNEIADGHGRVALIIARFDLERWLDGTMLHSVFITSPQDIAEKYPDESSQTNWHHARAGTKQFLESGAPETNIRALRDAVQSAKREIQKLEQNPKIPQDKKAAALEKAEKRLAEARTAFWPGFWAILIDRMMKQYDGERGKYVQAVAEDQLKEQKETASWDGADLLLLALARKNPSAARLLRVWQTTEEFLEAQVEVMTGDLSERKRLVFMLDNSAPKGIYTAEVPGVGRVEVFVREAHEAQTVTYLSDRQLADASEARTLRLLKRERGEPLRKPISLSVNEIKRELYIPYQVITTSPNLMLTMVPADKALEATEHLRQAYVEEFGKVQGRLPFHVGLIFMDVHYPMFAALDTARRLAETFDAITEQQIEDGKFVGEIGKVTHVIEEDGAYALTLKNERFGTWTWEVPAQRGDGETDWYHPYFLVKEGVNLEARGMSLVGPYGRWVHVSELQAGDQIGFWPNLFDFMFLDTVSRRFDAHTATGSDDRRPHALMGERSPRPYLLERLPELRKLWQDICAVKPMSETKLAAAANLLARKWKVWEPGEDGIQETYRWLVRQVAERDFSSKDGFSIDEFEEAVMDGSFFDVVELYRHILKQKIASEKEQEAQA